MTYVGHYTIDSNEVSASLAINKYSDHANLASVVGLNNFHLKIQGQLVGTEFSLVGSVVEDSSRTITIHAKKYSDL